MRDDPLRDHRRHAHRRQPVPRRRQPHGHREHLLARRLARGRRDGHPQPDRRRHVAGRGRHHDDVVGQARARRASPRRSTSRATSTSRCRTSRPRSRRRSASCPTSAQAPVVSKSNPDDQPIITIGVSGPFSRQLLADVARYQVEDMLETVPGVGQVTMMGYLDRNIRIWVDAEKLVATGTTVTRRHSAPSRSSTSTMPGGQLDNGGRALDVRVLGEAADLDTLRNIVVRNARQRPGAPRGRGARRGRLRGRDQSSRGSNGAPVQAMGILKQPGSNAVGVAKAVRAVARQAAEDAARRDEGRRPLRHDGLHQESVNEIGIELGPRASSSRRSSAGSSSARCRAR